MLIILGTLAFALVSLGVIVLATLQRTANDPSAGRSTSGNTQAFTQPPAAAVQRIHTALHDMGALCKPGANAATQRQIGYDVDQLITFARAYPEARFKVDDENGQSLDLLLIASDETRACAPAATARAYRALPARLRTRSPTGTG